MFVAIDGEADKSGRYVVMCDSTGRTLYQPRGISTSDALNFILTVPGKPEVVCYGLNYDANQWVKDVPRAQLERLASDEHKGVYRNMYKLEWLPGKMFTVTIPGRTVTVCEVFGFFQTSFVKALQAWGIEQPAEIETMKQKRGTFTQSEIDRVIAYCLEECKLLVQVMEKLRDACETAECVPTRRWIGAGSIASALMKRNGVRAHHMHDVDLFGKGVTDEFVLRAYFGGRVELYRQGWTAEVQTIDVRSAYPAAAMLLPSLSDGTRVTKTRVYDPGAEFALWRVSWNASGRSGQIAPFPVRLPKGDICYPWQGSGVYHAAEVKAAIECGYNVTVHDGVTLGTNGERPFEWIEPVFKLRAEYKARGSFAEKALKLGLNSVYGKTAQGYGFGQRPPYQSYFWAGFITSYTRARVLRRLAAADRPVMVATDGIVVQGSLTVADENRLGGWEVGRYDRIATIQPGVYLAQDGGDTFVKSRGFFARDVDYPALVEQFYKDPLSTYHFDSRRFIGVKVALHRKDFNVWRTWPDEKRSVAFEVKNKQRVTNADGSVDLYPIEGPYDSLPYVPKQSLYDDPSDETLESMVRDDQPHREVD